MASLLSAGGQDQNEGAFWDEKGASERDGPGEVEISMRKQGMACVIGGSGLFGGKKKGSTRRPVGGLYLNCLNFFRKGLFYCLFSSYILLQKRVCSRWG